MKEEDLRTLLDERGILRSPGALESPPDRSAGYAVFAQRTDAFFDIGALKQQAGRFFNAKVGLSVDKHYGVGFVPQTDIAHVVVATDDGTASGTRLVYGRPADASDHAAAESAERLQNTSGMSILAQRCNMLWIVIIEAAATPTGTDRVALTIAALFASHFLGPVLSPDGTELFGVRTARTKLERAAVSAQPFR